ncbi:MAG: penicillin-binding protein 1A, partial [Hyphomonadaceae bacterium]
AVVTNVAGGKITVSTPLGRSGLLAADDVSWAAAGAARDKKRALTRGAVVYAEPLKNGQFGLRQTPQLEGALVALDPRTGRVLAMVGGYSFGNSQYNRVTQAKRQPGSSFKPIVYTAALEYGLTPATLIEDAPFQIQAGDGTVYNPQNYEAGEFFGPSTLRTGVEKSRNAMTVRLAYEMGMDKVVEEGKKLGVYDDLMPVLAMALGAGETTLMRLTNAYASFVNGGKKVTPVLVDRVQDRTGKTVFRADMRACEGCNAPYAADAAPPEIPDTREQVLDPIIAYQITSILEGVVQRGTGQVVKSVGKPLAGKTGTTNDYKDAWFVGFSPDLVAGVWIGFDQPRTLGEGETGGGLSAPVFRDFMNVALKDQPATPFRLPPGVRLVKIDYKTGLLPGPNTTETILEAFRPGTEPVRDTGGGQQVIFGAGAMDPRALAGLDSTPSDEQPAGAGAAAPPPPMITPTRDEPLGQLY